MWPSHLHRRHILAAALAAPLLALPGCTALGGFGLTEAIRRVLTLSSQRAFARLLQPGGFYDDRLARIELPPEIGGPRAGSVVGAILAAGPVRAQLLELLNDAAVEGAGRAAPLIADSIRNASFADAAAIIGADSGAPATRALREHIGDRLVTAMFPEIGAALRVADDPLLGRVLQAATGIDIAGLGQYVAREAADGIYAAMGREEEAIRADPEATGDPVIIGAFGVG